jgi:pyruvate kinase
VKGSLVEITTDYTREGNANLIACSYPGLPKSVKVGSQILIADGTIVTIVKEVHDKHVIVEVLNNAMLSERKNMSLPGAIIDLPTITEKDEDDLVNFGLKYSVDIIFLSFVRKAEDLDNCRDILGPRGTGIRIISKIEN